MLGKRKIDPVQKVYLDYKKTFREHRSLVTLLLAVVLCFSLLFTAFAKDTPEDDSMKVTKFITENGHVLDVVKIGKTYGFVHSPDCEVCYRKLEDICSKALVDVIDSITIEDEKMYNQKGM